MLAVEMVSENDLEVLKFIKMSLRIVLNNYVQPDGGALKF